MAGLQEDHLKVQINELKEKTELHKEKQRYIRGKMAALPTGAHLSSLQSGVGGLGEMKIEMVLPDV